jgi:hypothetical protein
VQNFGTGLMAAVNEKCRLSELYCAGRNDIEFN